MGLVALALRNNQNLASKCVSMNDRKLEITPVLNIIDKREIVQQRQSMFIPIFLSSAHCINLRMMS
jgi:hypothetical protein